MIIARRDPSLSATVLSRRTLVYTDEVDASFDRPPHVRAGSGIARIGSKLAVIQDDASFLAIVDGSEVRAVPFPPGPNGRRQFGERIGNKGDKLDLESCIARGDTLIAFGSGSTSARERVLVVDGVSGPSPSVRVVDASSFYALLRADLAFSGGELNIEGAALRGDTLVFFQRGNGGGVSARNATCEIGYGDFSRYLESGAVPPPAPRRIVQYDLGTVEGVSLTFTDATCTPSGLLVFLAAAEASPNATDDGPVVGVAIGCIDDDGSTRLVGITDVAGSPLSAKVEGISMRPDDRTCADIVTDRDDPDAPCEIYTIAIRGF